MICVEKKQECSVMDKLFLTSLDEAQRVRSELERSIINFNKKISKNK